MKVMVSELLFLMRVIFFVIGIEKGMDFLPQLRSGNVRAVIWPNGSQHLLQGKCCNFEELSNAGVGAGTDCSAFAPVFLSLHHDVAVGNGLVVAQ